MPFDFTTPDTAATALTAFHEACEHPQGQDWESIARALASFIPKPRKAKVQIDTAPTFEWAEYSDNQRKGKGANYMPGHQASFTFADGITVNVQLCHHKGKDLPDWAGASRCAVAFYRARIVSRMVRARFMTMDQAERFAHSFTVPAIVRIRDIARQVSPDVARANDTTADRRKGKESLLGFTQPA